MAIAGSTSGSSGYTVTLLLHGSSSDIPSQQYLHTQLLYYVFSKNLADSGLLYK
jgi:hypothetical protein